MKSNDIAMVILVGFVSAMVAFLVANSLLGQGNFSANIETMEAIGSQVEEPSNEYFHTKSAVNPSVEVIINKPSE